MKRKMQIEHVQIAENIKGLKLFKPNEILIHFKLFIVQKCTLFTKACCHFSVQVNLLNPMFFKISFHKILPLRSF